eukprot:m.200025 g.200025  ORF g.200025 m.200025 type:complete len:494 (+) comp15494_c8_seq7:7006-8487(+)
MDSHRSACWTDFLLPVKIKLMWVFQLRLMDGSVAMTVTDVSVLGRLSTDYLAAASLANVWMNVTYNYMNGFGDAIRLLASQAMGAKNPTLACVWYQRGVLWLLLIGLFISATWLATPYVLRIVESKQEILDNAEVFSLISIAWIFPRLATNALDGYLQSHKIVRPQLLLSLFFVGFNLGMNILLVHGAGGWGGLGFIGSPCATVISQYLLCLSLHTYALFINRDVFKPYRGWRQVDFFGAGSKQFLAVGAPLAFGVCVEDWQIEVVAIFAGRLGDVVIATHNAMLQLFFVLASFEWGFSKATIVRVGYHLGNRDIAAARHTTRIGYIVSVAFAIVIAALFFFLRGMVARIFSTDPEVEAKTSEIAWLCGLGYACLSIFYASMATLSGQARSGVVAVSFFVGAWCVSVPLAYVFAFVIHLDLIGLWYALTAGYFVVTVIATVGVARSDWDAVMRAAVARSASKSGDQAHVQREGETQTAREADETSPLMINSVD